VTKHIVEFMELIRLPVAKWHTEAHNGRTTAELEHDRTRAAELEHDSNEAESEKCCIKWDVYHADT
jgi:hypothetical protein